LIEDLLMVSRIENRALPQQPEEIKLEVLLRDVIATIPDAEARVTVEVHDEAAEIEADADHVQRIVINLVQNGLKYASGSPIEVIAKSAPNQTIAISFIDHGPGIAPEARDRVFERFQQLEPSATRSQGGTGLGLNIVKGLVTGMGGRIELSQTDGGGATFTVFLPRAPGSVSRGIAIL
ncbi:MAG: HAMP domain-containing histidine kinase, partial [Acidimicrobiia bacterium]|nr:HAMP domain-containing histidine kinase [Acidimicrobiia bacterium]